MRLRTDVQLLDVTTRDTSEARYVMYDEAIRAIIDGAVELRRDASWSALPTIPQH